MITAVDSSVLIDLLTDPGKLAERATAALGQAAVEGSLVVCETVIAEISPALPHGKVEAFLDACSVRFVPSSRDSALLAGETFKSYLKRGGKRGRVLADFIIAAHAFTHADRLLTRDRGYYRDYFRKLKVWEPDKDS